jgi:hypothetical protein
MKEKLHWGILDEQRKKLLPRLTFLKEEGFYLAGGTGLALQIGHRRSLDFDFYTPQEYFPEAIYQKYVEQCKGDKIELVKMAKGWLNAKINTIEVTHFIYKYPLIEPLVKTDYLNIASKIDIAAMKLIALVQRGTYRDFIDMYFLIKELSLKTILLKTREKFTGYDVYLGLRALLYFDDAEADERRDSIKMLVDVPKWEGIKKFLREQVFSVQKEL